MKPTFRALFALLLFSVPAIGQVPLYDNYQFNKMAINPAYTGIRGHFAVTGVVGSQFNGTFRPSPVVQNVIVDGSSYKQLHNFGFQGFNANYAGFTNAGMNLSYAFRKIYDGFSITLGGNGGFTAQPNVVAVSATNIIAPYAGLGFLAATDALYLGISKPQLYQNTSRVAEIKRPLFIQSGAFLGDAENVLIHTNAMLELNKANNLFGHVAHANAHVWFGGQLGLGAGYRYAGQKNGFQNATSRWVLSAEYQVSTAMRAGLGYDTNPLQSVNQNTLLPVSGPLPRGIIQLIIRYEAESNRDDNPNFRFF